MKLKTANIIFWITTILLFIFEGIMPVLTFQTELAKEGIRHLGYPDYFGPMIVAFRIPGILMILIPKAPPTLKEWAYAGFTFEFIAASISHTAVDGFSFNTIMPIIVLAVLMLSYYTWHVRKAAAANAR